jgi:HPt (histidine-containing phosphotransfer) domain-containing protein
LASVDTRRFQDAGAMSHVANAAQSAVYSSFQDDPDFRELLEQFAVVIEERRDHLQESYAAGDLPSVRKNAHQLAGAGGGYGFDELSVLAKSLELACDAPTPNLDEIGPLLDEVVNYLGRVRID